MYYFVRIIQFPTFYFQASVAAAVEMFILMKMRNSFMEDYPAWSFSTWRPGPGASWGAWRRLGEILAWLSSTTRWPASAAWPTPSPGTTPPTPSSLTGIWRQRLCPCSMRRWMIRTNGEVFATPPLPSQTCSLHFLSLVPVLALLNNAHNSLLLTTKDWYYQ